MKRLPVIVLVMVISASFLGLWMAIEGLHLRLFGEALSFLGAGGFFWSAFESMGIDPASTAWPLITIGTAWIGAVCCFLIRMGGIQRIMLIFGLISLLFLFPGTILGAIVLICLWIPATREWLEGAGDVQA
jgi:hypothetical protein